MMKPAIILPAHPGLALSLFPSVFTPRLHSYLHFKGFFCLSWLTAVLRFHCHGNVALPCICGGPYGALCVYGAWFTKPAAQDQVSFITTMKTLTVLEV